MKFPSKIYLPFGYVATVKLVPPGDLIDRDTGQQLDGLWNPDTKTVLINNKLPVRRQRYVTTHEMVHVVIDWQHHLFDRGIIQA